MRRALFVLFVLMASTAPAARADSISDNVTQLTSKGSVYKVRLASALALSKSKDPRAIIALSDSLNHDSDETIRRVAALAMEKMIDNTTPPDAASLAFSALDKAASSDKDAKVRETAASTLKRLAPYRNAKKKAGTQVETVTKGANSSAGNGPGVYVQIDRVTDQSKKLSGDTGDRVIKIVKKGVDRTGYATSWPGGGQPTAADLSSAKSRGFIVASTIKKIEITKASSQTQVACNVEIRISPWNGKDGGERWEANKAASATGSAKAMTGNNAREVSGGIRDCLEAVAEDVTSRQVVPFLKRLAQAGS